MTNIDATVTRFCQCCIPPMYSEFERRAEGPCDADCPCHDQPDEAADDVPVLIARDAIFVEYAIPAPPV